MEHISAVIEGNKRRKVVARRKTDLIIPEIVITLCEIQKNNTSTLQKRKQRDSFYPHEENLAKRMRMKLQLE